jgi:hypothetical protein
MKQEPFMEGGGLELFLKDKPDFFCEPVMESGECTGERCGNRIFFTNRFSKKINRIFYATRALYGRWGVHWRKM